MVKKLLADRFRLKFHFEKRELTVYEITVAKDGPKLTKTTVANPHGGGSLFFRAPGILPAFDANMEDLAEALQAVVLDRPVLDHTGIQGRFDFLLKWTPDENQLHQLGVYTPPPKEPSDAPPDLYTALQQELGLKLDRDQGSGRRSCDRPRREAVARLMPIVSRSRRSRVFSASATPQRLSLRFFGYNPGSNPGEMAEWLKAAVC